MSETEHEEIRFRDAMTELRGILDALDSDEVDLDELSGLVERAAVLIRTCRARIDATEFEVSRILDDLESEEPPARD